jgi:type IV pilus assembly protein PilA
MPTWAIVLIAVGGFFVVIGGTLGVLAIYGVRKYIVNAKTAEARNAVGQIGRDAVTAYEAEVISPGGKPVRRLCASATVSVPDSIAKVRGSKYQSVPSDWELDAARDAGFACLKFSMSLPQYFLYAYKAHGASAPDDGFQAVADGDLDGDGTTSQFSLEGRIGPTGELLLAPSLLENNPEE